MADLLLLGIDRRPMDVHRFFWMMWMFLLPSTVQRSKGLSPRIGNSLLRARIKSDWSLLGRTLIFWTFKAEKFRDKVLVAVIHTHNIYW